MPAGNSTIATNLWGLIDGTGLRTENSPYGDMMNAVVRDLSQILNTAKSSVASADRNPRFTPTGKKDARNSLGEGAYAAIDALSAREKKLQADLKAAGVPTRLPSEREWAKSLNLDPVHAYLILKEVRQKLSGMDQVEAASVIKEAARNADTAILVAANGAYGVPFTAVVGADVMQSAFALWVETQTPEPAKSTQEAISTLRFNLATAKKAATTITGYVPPPVIKAA